MTIARHRPINIPRPWDWDTSTGQLVAMGYDPISLMKFSSKPAPEPMEGNNVGLRTGGRIGALQLVAVRIYPARKVELVTPLPSTMSVTTSTETTFFLRTDASVQSARYTRDCEPVAAILAEGGLVLWGDSVEPSGARVVTQGYVAARNLPVITAADLDRLVASIVAAGGERDDAPDEPPLVNPAWPLELQVETLASLLRKALRRLDAIEADDDPAGDVRPRRAHRRVNPLPEPITS